MPLSSALPARLPQTSGAGGTYYVDATGGTGDDTRSAAAAQSQSTPWATIRHAIDNVPSGSFIKVLPGVIPIRAGGLGTQVIYCYNHAFSTADPVTVMPLVPGSVIIQCTQVDNSWAGWIYNSTGFRVQGFIFQPLVDYSGNSQLFQTNMVIDQSSRIELVGNTFNESGEKGVLIRGGPYGSGITSDDIWIYGNTFRPGGADPFAYVSGLDFPYGTYYGSRGSHFIYGGGWGTNPGNGQTWDGVNGARRLVVANNVFVGSTKGRMIELGPACRDSFVVNNTFYGNHNIQKFPNGTTNGNVNGFYAAGGQSALGVVQYCNASLQQYKSGNNVVANNIFVDLDGNAVGAGTGGGTTTFDLTTVTKNLAFQCRNGYGYAGDPTLDYNPNTAGTVTSQVQFTVTGNFNDADPLFNDAAHFDYRLKAGSPAIGVADPQYCPLDDITGTARNATTPTLGAYEASVAGGSSGGTTTQVTWSRIAGIADASSGVTAVSSRAVTLDGPIAVGDVIVVNVQRGMLLADQSLGACTDQLGNVYTKRADGLDSGNSQGFQVWTAIATVAGTPTITVTSGAGGAKSYFSVQAQAYRASQGTVSFDQVVARSSPQTTSSGTDNCSIGPATLAADYELAVACFNDTSDSQTFNAGTNWTEDRDSGVSLGSFATIESRFMGGSTANTALTAVGSVSGSGSKISGAMVLFKSTVAAGGGVGQGSTPSAVGNLIQWVRRKTRRGGKR